MRTTNFHSFGIDRFCDRLHLGRWHRSCLISQTLFRRGLGAADEPVEIPPVCQYVLNYLTISLILAFSSLSNEYVSLRFLCVCHRRKYAEKLAAASAQMGLRCKVAPSFRSGLLEIESAQGLETRWAAFIQLNDTSFLWLSLCSG